MYLLQNSRTPTLAPVPFHQQPNKSHPSDRNTSVAAQPVTSITQITPKPQNHFTKKPRRRGVVLTEQGWQKLLQSEVIYDRYGKRYTLEELSERTLLDPRTIGRIIDREVGVDKRSLRTFFDAFNLKLEVADYITPVTDKWHKNQSTQTQTEGQLFAASSRLHSQEELTDLKQQIIANCQRLASLLGIAETNQTTLTVNLSPRENALKFVNIELDKNACI